MLKRSSKTQPKLKSKSKSKQRRSLPKPLQKLARPFLRLKAYIQKKRAARLRLHRSFRRSYREDYTRVLTVPGPLYHAMDSLRLLFKNWKLFLPLILFAVGFNIILVGLMSEDTYVKFQTVLEETNQQVASGTPIGNFAKASLLLVSTVTSGGLSSGLSGVQIIFAVISFLLIWLITIYLLRFRLAGKPVRLRDGFYNALTPLLSTFVVFFVGFLECIPLFVVIFTYSTAVQTDFLTTPFYALIYFLFAVALLLLSFYLLSSTLVALVAVSAPGVYPLVALRTASNLMLSRRLRFITRLICLVFTIAAIWVIVMLPLIALDLFLKSHFSWLSGFPFIPFCLVFMTCFSFTYFTAYLYLYYRRILNSEDNR
ncbi:hypothetical protein IJI72_02680 [Candidatus Saccharibacteria bacterium]|nr:hypothetical protein [Candidatus Saccharibacteria bacterium]